MPRNKIRKNGTEEAGTRKTNRVQEWRRK